MTHRPLWNEPLCSRPLWNRRTVVKAALGLTVTQVLLTMKCSEAMTMTKNGTGKPGEFDFLTGEWRIKNRRKKPDNDWDEFDGQATVWGFLNGIGSLEELRIPARQFAGMGLRLLDVENGIWNDFWVNAKSPVLTTPGLEGQFKDGAGTFTASEQDGDIKVLVRGVWDQITPDSCRWYQSSSKDDGKTWEDNWIMHWHRVKK
jgi:hypothetical protein